MSERDFVERLGDELTAAARRRVERRGAGWRRVLPPRLARRAHGRALVLVGAVALIGAGGTVGLLATRGEVGGPPSLTFARLSPQQVAAGVRPLTRPVVFARGRLAYDGRPWQLVGFQTTRGLCVEIDFPRQDRAGGCGSPDPRGGRPLDWQAQIAIARLARGLVLGAVDPAAATVRVRHGGTPAPHPPGRPGRLVHPQVAHARVIHVRAPRLLNALGRRRPFAYWLAELRPPYFGMLAEARGAHGELLGRAGVSYAMNDTSSGIRFQSHACGGLGIDVHRRPRLVPTLPPRALRAQIAALRRPRRTSDTPPRLIMDMITRSPLWATVEIDALRLLRRTRHERFYIVPTTERPYRFAPPAACLRTLTPRQREREATLQRRSAARARQLRLVLYVVGPHSTGGSFDLDPDAGRHGRAAYGMLRRHLVGIAPDDVARVAVRFRNGSRADVPVVGSVWIASAPHPNERARAVIWLDGQGHVLRRLR